MEDSLHVNWYFLLSCLNITFNGTSTRTSIINHTRLSLSDFFCLFAFLYMVAAKLPVLLHVCFLCNPSLHIYSWLLLGLYQEDHELRGDINLESNDQNPCFNCTNNIQFRFCLVCWRPHCFPYISNQHKPGLNAIQLIIPKP